MYVEISCEGGQYIIVAEILRVGTDGIRPAVVT